MTATLARQAMLTRFSYLYPQIMKWTVLTIAVAAAGVNADLAACVGFINNVLPSLEAQGATRADALAIFDESCAGMS